MRFTAVLVALFATVALAAPPAQRWSTPCGGHVGTCLIEKSKKNVNKQTGPVLKQECICTMLKQHPECAKEGYTCPKQPVVPKPTSAVPTSAPGALKRYGIHINDGFNDISKYEHNVRKWIEQLKRHHAREAYEQDVEARLTRYKGASSASDGARPDEHSHPKTAIIQRDVSASPAPPSLPPYFLSAKGELVDVDKLSEVSRATLWQNWQKAQKETNKFMAQVKAKDPALYKRMATAALPEHPLMNNPVLRKFDDFNNGADIATRWVEPSHGKQLRERTCVMRYANQDGQVTKNERLWQLDFCMNSPEVPVTQAMPKGWEKKARLTDVDQPTENCFRFKLEDGFWRMHCKNGEGNTGFGRWD